MRTRAGAIRRSSSIHGNQTERVPEAYRRYLINRFRKVFRLKGTPVRLQLKSSDNPFKGRRNKLTPRQDRKSKAPHETRQRA